MNKVAGYLSFKIDFEGMSLRDMENYIDEVQAFITEKAKQDYDSVCEMRQTYISITEGGWS